MSEVGVLNLTIKDNSEQAGQGLNSLAGALRAVKEAKRSFDLTSVGQQLTQLAKTINEARGTSTTIKNLGTMFNAINKFANLKNFNIDSEKLRDTANHMIELANAKERIDEASKSGAGVSDWRMGMSGIADSAKETVQTVAEQTDKLEKTLTHFQQMTGKVTNIQLFGGKKQVPGQIAMDLDGTAQRIQEIVSQINIADAVISKTTSEAENAGSRIASAVSSSTVTDPATQIADSFRNAATNVRYYSSALETAIPKVQELSSAEMIEAGNARYAAMSERERVLAMAEATGKIPPIDTSRTQEMTANFVQTASEVQNLNISLTETGDIVTSTLIPRFTQMYQIWSMMAYAFGMFANSAKQLMSGESFLALGDGRTPGQLLLGDGSDPQTFLSTWVQTGEQWKQNWVDWASEAAQEMRASWSPDWIIGEGTVTAATEELEDVTKVTDDIRQTASATSALSEEVENLGEAASGQAQAFNEAIEFARQWNAYQPGQNRAMEEARADVAWIDNLVNSSSKIDLLNMKIEDMTAKLYEGATSGNMTGEQIANLAMQIRKTKEEVEELTASTTGITGAFNTFKDALKKMFPTLTSLLKRFKSMVIMRSLRYLVRQLSAGFSEGVQNMYWYSKAVGTSFAPSMDAAATSLQQMKNSIGAAVAPLIQTLVPALQTVINWVITVINYFNQFFALLNGHSSWTRAIPSSADAFQKTGKAAKGASDSIKDLLADWDELNIIQNASGGKNGSGATGDYAKDYLSMFEEVSKFDGIIKDAVDFINERLGGLPGLVKKIGAIILGWKLSKAFLNGLQLMNNLLAGVGVLLVIQGIELASSAGYDIGHNGLNSNNILKAVYGVLETAFGAGTVGFALGGITGGVVGLTIGALASLAVLGYNMDQGYKDSLYGDLRMSADEIQGEVDKLFKFDVTARYEKAKEDHDSLEQAKNDVLRDITGAERDYITLKLLPSPANATDLANSVNTLVTDANELLKNMQSAISVGFGFDVSFDDPEKEQKFLSKQVLGLDTYVGDLGKEIGTILEDNIIDAVTEKDLLDDLMRKLTNVTRAIATGKASGSFAAGVEMDFTGTDWAKVDRQSLIEYANKYSSELEKVKETAKLQALDEKSTLGGIYAGMLQREMDNPGTYTTEELEQARIDFEEYGMQKAIDDFVKDATTAEYEIFKSNVITALSGAVGKAKFNASMASSDLASGNLLDWFKQNLGMNLGWGNIFGDEQNKLFANLLSNAGMTGWELLSDDIKKKYINTIVKSLGKSSDTYKQIKEQLGVPIDDILAIDNSKWAKWSNKERARYIKYLTEAYGADAVEDAMNKKGINYKQYINPDETPKYVPVVDEGWQFPLSYTAPTEDEMTELNNKVSDAAEEAEKSVGLFDAISDFLSGLSYHAPDTTVPMDIIPEETPTATLPVELVPENAYLDYTVSIDDQEKLAINPDIELSKDAQTAIEMVRNAINSGLGMDEVKAASSQVIETFGKDTFLEAMPYIQQLMDAYRKLQEGNYEDFGNLGSLKPWRVSGAAGMSDTSYNNGAVIQSSGVVKTEPVDNTQDVNNMEQGVRKGSSEMLSALQSILRVAEAIQRKEFKVVLTPNSSWARHNGASQSAMNYVTGDA